MVEEEALRLSLEQANKQIDFLQRENDRLTAAEQELLQQLCTVNDEAQRRWQLCRLRRRGGPLILRWPQGSTEEVLKLNSRVHTLQAEIERLLGQTTKQARRCVSSAYDDFFFSVQAQDFAEKEKQYVGEIASLNDKLQGADANASIEQQGTSGGSTKAADVVGGMMAMFRGQAPPAASDVEAAGKVEDMRAAVDASNKAKSALNAALIESRRRAEAAEAEVVELKELMTGLQASFEEERQQILSQFDSKTQQPPQESNDHHSTLQQQGEHTDAHPSFQMQLKDAREALTEQTALREKAEIDVGNLQAQLQAMEQQLKVEADRTEEALRKYSEVAATLKAENAASTAVSEGQEDSLAEMKRKTQQLAEQAKRQLQEKGTQIENLSQANAAANAELAECSNRLKEQLAWREKAETDICDLQAQLQGLEEQLKLEAERKDEALVANASLERSVSQMKSQSARAESAAGEEYQQLKNNTDMQIRELTSKLESTAATAAQEKAELRQQYDEACKQRDSFESTVEVLTASEANLKDEVQALQSLADDIQSTDAALTAAKEEKELLLKQVAKMKEETQKSTQRREKMLTEAVMAEREAWEAQLDKLKGDHAVEKAMMEKMISKVAPEVAQHVEPEPVVPLEYEDIAARLQEAEQLIDTQQSSLVQKEKELVAIKSDPSGSVVWDLRDRLDKAESLVVMQREMIRTKDEQLKTAIDSAMGVAVGAEETMAAQELESGSVGDLRKQVEKLTREKEEVLEKAKQAVEELTGQLARTRSAREKDLQRRVTTCEEAINNLKQQAAIDLQVKNFLAERVQQLESPDGFESEMETIKTQLTILKGENATFAEESTRSASLVKELQDQVRTITREKEDTLHQIQANGINAVVSQQLQDLRDALQAVHAERDDALEQLKSANHVKREMATKLIAMGAAAPGDFEQARVSVPGREH